MNNPYATDALKGMRAVVCGASKGIGRATAEMLAACGADVIALSRSAPDIPGVRSMSLDLEDAAAIEKTIAGILVAGPIHILVNNAGGPPGGPLLDNEIEDFEAPLALRTYRAAGNIVRATRGLARLIRHVRRRRCELIFCNGTMANLAGGLIAKLTGTPVMWHALYPSGRTTGGRH